MSLSESIGRAAGVSGYVHGFVEYLNERHLLLLRR